MTNKCVQFRRGTTEEHKDFTGLEGEITIDTDKSITIIHDGKTVGGIANAREDLSNVNVEIIAEKGIAKKDLSNVSLEIISEKGLAKSDLTNVSDDDISGRGIAKSDLSNVSVDTICDKGIAKNDLSNVSNIYGKSVWISNEITPVIQTRSIANHNLNLQNPLMARGEVLLKCAVAEAGYQPGEYISNWSSIGKNSNVLYPISKGVTLTQNTIETSTGGDKLAAISKTGSDAYTFLNFANWRYVFRIWY